MLFHKACVICQFSLKPAVPEDIPGVVGDNRVGPRPENRGNYFPGQALFIAVSELGHCLDHRIFAADVVGAERQIDQLPDAAYDVKVRERRFYHHDVRALLHVEQDLAFRLAGVPAVHLVACSCPRTAARFRQLP